MTTQRQEIKPSHEVYTCISNLCSTNRGCVDTRRDVGVACSDQLATVISCFSD